MSQPWRQQKNELKVLASCRSRSMEFEMFGIVALPPYSSSEENWLAYLWFLDGLPSWNLIGPDTHCFHNTSCAFRPFLWESNCGDPLDGFPVWVKHFSNAQLNLWETTRKRQELLQKDTITLQGLTSCPSQHLPPKGYVHVCINPSWAALHVCAWAGHVNVCNPDLYRGKYMPSHRQM